VEYQAIVDAGLVLQIDDPFLTDIFVDPTLDHDGRHRRAAMYVELSYWPEQVRSDCSAYGEYKSLYDDGLVGLLGVLFPPEGEQGPGPDGELVYREAFGSVPVTSWTTMA
jgi:hypothetical protein